MIRFGPAGWTYRDWYGRVYPRPAPKGFDPLTYLARFVSMVEINSSFYRAPTPATCAAWRDRVAGFPDFRFTAKLSQRFTHRRSPWTSDQVDEVRAGFDVLHQAGLLGAVLVQFPWSFRLTAPNRHWLEKLSAAFRAYPLVLEVRHSSWGEQHVLAELTAMGVGIANIDQPPLPNFLTPTAQATSSVGYVRFHGRNAAPWVRGKLPVTASIDNPLDGAAAGSAGKYDYLYTASELESWAARIQAIAALPSVNDVYVVANNTHGGKAMANLMQLQAMVTGRPAIAPPQLMTVYADVLRGHVQDAAETMTRSIVSPT